MARVYLMRHGDAVFKAKTDAERTLSEHGRGEVAAMVQYLAGETITRVETSPYVRARQTAAIIQSELEKGGAQIPVNVSDYITPNDEPRRVIQRLQATIGDADSVLIVTHQPLVGMLISLLVDGVALGMPLATASVACLEIPYFDVGQGTLEWLRSP